MTTIVLVCGGRHYKDEAHVNATLTALVEHYGDVVFLNGACITGADMLAWQWANKRGLHTARVEALWHVLGRRAGPVRNSAMLVYRPDVCVAFPGGAGTVDMVAKARAAGVPTWEV